MMPVDKKIAVIIGAGPAGLTAAYELLTRTDIKPIVIEADPQYVGGISRTVNYKNNLIDIGGHRFFSKSDRVMRFWAEMMPILNDESDQTITYQRTSRSLVGDLPRATPAHGDRVLTIRPRQTRIIYQGKFFAYPIELSLDTLRKLGVWKTIKVGVSYLYAQIFPRRPETTLEDFFINRFGTELYHTFFKSYTEKVWGVSCRELSAAWGAQRVKGLSITKAIQHALKKTFGWGALAGKKTETSLIEQFLYPTFGPGQMWEIVKEKVEELGGEVMMGTKVVGFVQDGKQIKAIKINREGKEDEISCDYVFSTADIRSIVPNLTGIPDELKQIGTALQYRDFLTVGLLLKDHPIDKYEQRIKDTWIYVHEPAVRVGRVQFFHNWQPKLVAEPNHGWLGLEYFVSEGDDLWTRSDDELVKLAGAEIEKLGISQADLVIDGTVIRQPKAYPGYFGAYEDFPRLREELDTFPNLFLVGRNGMHRYNNQDHSMLSAMTAVDLIKNGQSDRSILWEINTEEDYHEEKRS